MRVLYSFPHPLGAPGIGTTAWHQVHGLVAAGHRVTVSCTSSARPVVGATDVVETLSIRGHRVPHRTLGVDRALRRHDRRTAELLLARPDDYDIVHCWPAAAIQTMRAANGLGIRAVRELPNAHTAVAWELAGREAAAVGVELPPGHSHRPDPARLAVEEQEYALASALLAPSDFVVRSFEGRDPHAPLIRHRYGFDPERFPPPGTRPVRPFTVAFVGSGEPRKGLHHALHAWCGAGIGHRGARLIVTGHLLPTYRRRIAGLLRQPGVEVAAFAADVGAALRAADVLVLPSVEEGSALVTYEGQASGCALLVSDATGALFEPGVHGLLHRAGDVETLTVQLARLAGDDRLLARFRAAAIAHRPALTWERAGEQLAAAYEEVMTSCRTGPR